MVIGFVLMLSPLEVALLVGRSRLGRLSDSELVTLMALGLANNVSEELN